VSGLIQLSAQALYDSARSHKVSAEFHRRAARAAAKALDAIVREAETLGIPVVIQQPKGGRLVLGRKEHHGQAETVADDSPVGAIHH
jgi:predicted TIM-barrel fold metal-dependent hydrolase